MSELVTLMNERKSVRVFDPSFKINQESLEELLAHAISAPSSSNLQSWRFIAIQDEAMKKALPVFGNNRKIVENASAVIAVLGDTEAYKNVEEIYTQNVEAGYMDQSIADRTISNTHQFYPGQPKEGLMNIASYDAGLISMQLLLLAKERELDTIVMGGFDKAAFAKQFELEENIFPITLIAIGKSAAPAFNTTRLPLERVVKFY
ncbi:nitroreductase family protein [Cytobacillus kochii]|uniref:nitroreductase family protein n=1 Tax=Cytobacillus kochii TaxID=859143 RepID=UPI002789F579|nr:nitroreductase family protein [Cytobacillus kochii]MDQ0185746.1 nitroreductase [Cytobacillus kochii]